MHPASRNGLKALLVAVVLAITPARAGDVSGPAAAFRLKNRAGGEMSLSSLKGKASKRNPPSSAVTDRFGS